MLVLQLNLQKVLRLASVVHGIVLKVAHTKYQAKTLFQKADDKCSPMALNSSNAAVVAGAANYELSIPCLLPQQ